MRFSLTLSVLLSALLCGCAATPAGIVVSAVAQTAGNMIAAEHAKDSREDDSMPPTQRAKIRTELASGYFEQRQFKIAVEELNNALALDNNYVPAWNLLGLSYAEIVDNLSADNEFNKGLSLSSNDPDLLHNYASYLCFNKKEKESVPYFIKATEDRFYQEAHKSFTWAGICSFKSGDIDKADEYLRKSIRLNPQNPTAFFWLSEVSVKRNDYDKAQSYLAEHFKNSDATAQNLWLGIRIARARNDRDTFSALSSQLLKRYPNSEEAELLEKRQFRRP